MEILQEVSVVGLRVRDGFFGALTLLLGEGNRPSLCSTRRDVNLEGGDQEQQNHAVKPLQTHLVSSSSSSSKVHATCQYYLYLASLILRF